MVLFILGKLFYKTLDFVGLVVIAIVVVLLFVLFFFFFNIKYRLEFKNVSMVFPAEIALA